MSRIQLSFTRFRFGSVALTCLLSSVSWAQGPALTVTPGPTISSLSGISTVAPAAVAYDSAGNLFIADAGNHVVLQRTPTGAVKTFAGTRHQGFSGDGGLATSADLDTPTALAISPVGEVYIADSHNHRVRRVGSNGVITTIAGEGSCRFSGDGGAAINASFCLPSALALDTSGNLYVADQRNHRIRRVDTGGQVNTIAGDGEQTYSGDNSKAISAGLDSPAGLAVDTSGNVYISDTHNQRIRRVDSLGIITTVAAGTSNDRLIRPTGIALTTSGELLIADPSAHKISALSDGRLRTYAGNGEEASTGDNGSPANATLQQPAAVAVDSNQNVVIADRAGSTVRQTNSAVLTFAPQRVATASTSQSIKLTNSGSTPLTLAPIKFAGAFTQQATSCEATLAVGDQCTIQIVFTPSSAGQLTGEVFIAAQEVPAQTVSLSGLGVDGATTTSLQSDHVSAYAGSPVTLSATVGYSGPIAPTGSVAFADAGTSLGKSNLNGLTASFSAVELAPGTHSITATYSGDTLYTTSTSAPTIATIASTPDFVFASGDASSSSQTISAGQTATYRFSIKIPDGSLKTPVTFSATGLPEGATASFSPQSASSSVEGTLTVRTSANLAWIPVLFIGGLAFGRVKKSRITVFLLIASLAAIEGCGSGSKQVSRIYTITVNATATSVTGVVLQHSTTFSLTMM